MLYPKPLQKGARIALIGMSSAVPDGRLEPAVSAVKAYGFEPIIYESCQEKYYSFSGDDKRRAKDFEDAICDDSIDGVFCIRGGYGAARALEWVDWNRVKKAVLQNPKYFSGYSDVTAVHAALHELCGLVTWHTPMPSTEYYKPIDAYTEGFLTASFAGQPESALYNPEQKPFQMLSAGSAKGMLVGGNLSLLSAAIGTPYDLNTKGKILFIEDIGEEPYRLDRMLVQMRQAGKFKDAAGILLGAFTDCENKEGSSDMPLGEMLTDIFSNMDKPVLSGVCCGHCLPTMSLPFGAIAEIKDGQITLHYGEE